MKIYKDMNLIDFEFWSGAKNTIELITKEELLIINDILEDLYPEGTDENTINDIFWFETDWIAEMLGYPDFEKMYERRKNR